MRSVLARLLVSTCALLGVHSSAEAQAQPALSEVTRGFVSIDAPVIALTRVMVIDGTGAAPKTRRCSIASRR